MYTPKPFAEDRPEVLQHLIRSSPFGTLVTITSDGLQASHIPFVLKPAPPPYGALQGHVARANSQWRTSSPDAEALVIFLGPESYITPSWYPTKQETGKVVPTWNYVVVHAYGKLRVIEDEAWLKRHVEELTDQLEHMREAPWRVSDVPRDFTSTLLRAIVGLEIEMSRLVGKWKLGQNRSIEDQLGVLKGLRAEDTPSASSMVQAMTSRDPTLGVKE